MVSDHMARYELIEGTAKKFWQIELAGTSFRVTYGRIGSTGQTQTRSFANAEAAKKAHDALIAEKTRKGYTLTGGRSAKAAPASDTTKPAAMGGDGSRLAKAIERAKSWMNKNGAEALVKNLAPGANDATLAKAAKKLGFELPAELVELWKLHDGQRKEQNGFIGSLDLLGSREALLIREDVLLSVRWMLEDEDMIEDAELRTAEADERWIPFGTRDSDHLVIHAGTGRVFRVAKDAPPLSLAAKSLTEFFERYAKGMERGEYTVEEGFGDIYLAS
jgi:predicted DNA-binding WGR domain protein/cell wall assembly regulator SMI1